MLNYKDNLIKQYRNYQKTRFSNNQKLFDKKYEKEGSPPVFLKGESWRNILTKPNASSKDIDRLYALIPEKEKHRWFRSMNSSQALAQSILGNLFVYNSMNYLSTLKDDEGLYVFGNATISSDNFFMEYNVDYLGERRRTSLDGFLQGEYKIGIECKYTEKEIGKCSRPLLISGDNKYCNGDYAFNKKNSERCPLTELGIQYWKYVPKLFNWQNEVNLKPCPLNNNYQLVRNILAVGVKPDGTVSSKNGHVVLIYDDRNPAFQEKGKGQIAYLETRKALKEPNMLRKCSWQRIMQKLIENKVLKWLTDEINLKYGI